MVPYCADTSSLNVLEAYDAPNVPGTVFFLSRSALQVIFSGCMGSHFAKLPRRRACLLPNLLLLVQPL